MRYHTALSFTIALILTASFLSPVFAQSNQVSYTVNLTFSTIQVSYPIDVLPGDTVTLNFQVTPKSNVYLQSLTATVYYVDETGLHQIATQMLSGTTSTANGYYYMNSYNTGSFSKSFQVNIPSNAPRTSLVAIFSETAQSVYSNYYSYYPFYGYSNPYYNGNYSCSAYFCNYSSYPAYYSNYYPYSSYGSVSDSGIAPLSYIKASTPEYAALQTQYQTLEQQLNQTQAENQQLQNALSQQNSTINQLNQQLASVNGTIQIYQLVVLGLGILVVVLAVFSVYRGSKVSQPTEAQKS